MRAVCVFARARILTVLLIFCSDPTKDVAEVEELQVYFKPPHHPPPHFPPNEAFALQRSQGDASLRAMC
jgi:hypothetical protein